MRKKTAASPAAVSSCRKSLFATTRHLSELQKALKNGDHHRAGHPSRVSRTHPSAPLTKGSRFWGQTQEEGQFTVPPLLFMGHRKYSSGSPIRKKFFPFAAGCGILPATGALPVQAPPLAAFVRFTPFSKQKMGGYQTCRSYKPNT